MPTGLPVEDVTTAVLVQLRAAEQNLAKARQEMASREAHDPVRAQAQRERYMRIITSYETEVERWKAALAFVLRWEEAEHERGKAAAA